MKDSQAQEHLKQAKQVAYKLHIRIERLEDTHHDNDDRIRSLSRQVESTRGLLQMVVADLKGKSWGRLRRIEETELC